MGHLRVVLFLLLLSGVPDVVFGDGIIPDDVDIWTENPIGVASSLYAHRYFGVVDDATVTDVSGYYSEDSLELILRQLGGGYDRLGELDLLAARLEALESGLQSLAYETELGVHVEHVLTSDAQTIRYAASAAVLGSTQTINYVVGANFGGIHLDRQHWSVVPDSDNSFRGSAVVYSGGEDFIFPAWTFGHLWLAIAELNLPDWGEQSRGILKEINYEALHPNYRMRSGAVLRPF